MAKVQSLAFTFQTIIKCIYVYKNVKRILLDVYHGSSIDILLDLDEFVYTYYGVRYVVSPLYVKCKRVKFYIASIRLHNFVVLFTDLFLQQILCHLNSLTNNQSSCQL